MKKILVSIIAIGWLGFVFSCEKTEEKVSEVMKKELFDLHDKLMPETMKVEDMKAKLDSMKTGADSANIEAIKNQLDQANAGMMDWMHNFDISKLDSMANDQKIEYLKKQIDILKKVNEDTEASFKAYEDFTKNRS